MLIAPRLEVGVVKLGKPLSERVMLITLALAANGVTARAIAAAAA